MGDERKKRILALGEELQQTASRPDDPRAMLGRATTSLLGKGLEYMGRVPDAAFAAGRALGTGQGPGAATSELAAGLKGKRVGTQHQELEKLAPVPFSNPILEAGRRTGLLGMSIATDPLTYVGLGELTGAGKAAMKTAPELLLGAGKLSKAEQLRKGLRTGVSFHIPGTPVNLPLAPRIVQAKAVDLISHGFGKIGEAMKRGLYATGMGRKASEIILDKFTTLGGTEVTRKLRGGYNEMLERQAAHSVRDAAWIGAVDAGAQTIADTVSAQIGRKVDSGEIAEWAFDYAENGLRDPARFADTPDVVKQYGQMMREKQEELFQFETSRGVEISRLGQEPGAGPAGVGAQPKPLPREPIDASLRQRLEGTKVSDPGGEPIRVYHGATEGFAGPHDLGKAERSSLGPGIYYSESPEAAEVYTTGKHHLGQGAAAPNIRTAFLDIKNPLDLDAPLDPAFRDAFLSKMVEKGIVRDSITGALRNLSSQEFAGFPADTIGNLYRRALDVDPKKGRGMFEALESMGYDGLVHQGGPKATMEPFPHRYWVAFDPKQVVPSARPNLKSLDAQAAARLKAIAEQNAAITLAADQTVLDPQYLPNVVSDYGADWLELNREEMAKIAQLGKDHPSVSNIKAKDKFAEMRGFADETGRRPGAVEKNRMAREGTLPGYEGKKATQDIFTVRPAEAFLPRFVEGRRAGEEAAYANSIAKEFGTYVTGDKAAADAAAKAGLVSVSDTHPILRNYRFPAEVARELKVIMPRLGPESPFWKAALTIGAEANRLFMENLLVMPSTIARNSTDEFVRSWMSGAGVSDAAYAYGAASGAWNPLRRVLEKIKLGGETADAVSELGLQRLRVHPTLGPIVEENPALVSELGFDAAFIDPATGLRTKRSLSPTELLSEMYSKRVVGQGWNPGDLQEASQVAHLRARDRGMLKRIWTSKFNPFSENAYVNFNLMPARLLKRVQAFGDDFPRMMSFTRYRRMGLTADEAIEEMSRWHPMGRSSPFERKVFRKAVPFWRWTKFAIPFSFRVALEHPQIPYFIHKATQYLSMGTRANLDRQDVPSYLEKNFGVPVMAKKLKDGRAVYGMSSPLGFTSAYDAMKWTDLEHASDNLYSLINPFIAAVADIDAPDSAFEGLSGGARSLIDRTRGEPPPKDDSFLGVRMPAANANFLRRTLRGWNLLDKMALPKGLSQDEKAFRRKLALTQMFSPISVLPVVQGEELQRKKFVLEGAARALAGFQSRSLSQRGRLRGTPAELELRKEAQEARMEIGKRLRELSAR